MKIGILGGAFDPIHKDHIKTAKAVIDAGLVDRVRIMPCYGHKFGKKMATAKRRLEMTEIACAEARRETGHKIYASETEIILKHNGSTFDLMQLLQSVSPNPLYYIIGTDNAARIQEWHRWEDLLATVKFIVVQRKGEPKPKAKDWYLNFPHQYVDPDIGALSSTKVRDTIAKGGYEALKKKNLVSQEVFNYIVKHKLYT